MYLTPSASRLSILRHFRCKKARCLRSRWNLQPRHQSITSFRWAAMFLNVNTFSKDSKNFLFWQTAICLEKSDFICGNNASININPWWLHFYEYVSILLFSKIYFSLSCHMATYKSRSNTCLVVLQYCGSTTFISIP